MDFVVPFPTAIERSRSDCSLINKGESFISLYGLGSEEWIVFDQDWALHALNKSVPRKLDSIMTAAILKEHFEIQFDLGGSNGLDSETASKLRSWDVTLGCYTCSRLDRKSSRSLGVIGGYCNGVWLDRKYQEESNLSSYIPRKSPSEDEGTGQRKRVSFRRSSI